MPIFHGNTEITDIKHGNTEINSVWVGSNRVWTRGYEVTVDTATTSTQFDVLTYQYYAGFRDTHPTYTYPIEGSISPTKEFKLSPLINSSDPTPEITYLYHSKFWSDANGVYSHYMQLNVDQQVSNSGWTSMKVGNDTFNRTDAGYFSGYQYTFWMWTITTDTLNPFGTTDGATVQVSFT
jgi:hypothetical protein